MSDDGDKKVDGDVEMDTDSARSDTPGAQAAGIQDEDRWPSAQKHLEKEHQSAPSGVETFPSNADNALADSTASLVPPTSDPGIAALPATSAAVAKAAEDAKAAEAEKKGKEAEEEAFGEEEVRFMLLPNL